MSLFKKLNVVKESTDIFEAAKVVTTPLVDPKPGEVRVKVSAVGINACDLLAAAGLIFESGSPPYDFGNEAIGFVDKVGSEIKSIKQGQYVFVWGFDIGAFSEYVYVDPKRLILIDSMKPEYIGLGICGLTALIGLKHSAELKPKQSVLITAAAGGTGHIAVQVAKSMNCEVIGLCSSQGKKDVLKELGCDIAINYKEDNVSKVLENVYPNGVDVIWESIGGETLQTLFKHLAEKGRMIVLGDICGYKEKMTKSTLIDTNQILLKNADVHGFRLDLYSQYYSEYFQELIQKFDNGELKVVCDRGSNDNGNPFKGIEDVPRAIDHLYSRKSIGKILVSL